MYFLISILSCILLQIVLSEMKTEKISALISDKERTHKSRWVPPETHCVLSAHHDVKIQFIEIF